jgi:hypothetical protein
VEVPIRSCLEAHGPVLGTQTRPNWARVCIGRNVSRLYGLVSVFQYRVEATPSQSDFIELWLSVDSKAKLGGAEILPPTSDK